MDIEARSFHLSGDILDVGSKSNNSCYFSKIDTNYLKTTYSDINPQSQGVIKLDF